MLAVLATSVSAQQSVEDAVAELKTKDYFIDTDASRVRAAQDLEPFTLGGGVGLIISYGPAEGVPHIEKIADAYLEEFSTHGGRADFRVVLDDTPGVAVTVLIKDTAQGPFGAKDTYEMIPDFVAQNKFAHGL